jgi:hypothetical protein
VNNTALRFGVDRVLGTSACAAVFSALASSYLGASRPSWTSTLALSGAARAAHHGGRRHAEEAPHPPCHVALMGEPRLERHLAGGHLAPYEQRLGPLHPPLHHVPVHRDAR